MTALQGHHPALGILLGGVNFLAGQLAIGDRIRAADIPGNLAVGDTLHFKRMEPAEIGDLLEGQRRVVDQPDSGRLRHQNVGHEGLLK